MTTTNLPARIDSLEQKREERDRRDARDRILAREVGIEIGRRREREKTMREKNRSFARGFFLGMIFVIIIGYLAVHAERMAHASTIKPRGVMSAHAATPKRLPPHWKTWIKIGQCEQPGRGWKGINWTHDGSGVTFPGGLGFTLLLADWYRPADARGRMSKWTPLQQLWAAERMFDAYAKRGGQAYAATLWDCSADIGFYGFNADGSWR